MSRLRPSNATPTKLVLIESGKHPYFHVYRQNIPLSFIQLQHNESCLLSKVCSTLYICSSFELKKKNKIFSYYFFIGNHYIVID